MENELNPPKPKAKRRRRASKPAAESQFSESKDVISEEVVSEEPVKAAEPSPPAIEVTESPIVDPAPVPTPAPAPEPWKRPVRPMKQRKAGGAQRGVRKSKR